MSGFYNSLRFDTCNNDQQAYVDSAISDYNLNLAAYWRPQEGVPALTAVGVSPSFFGPIRGALTTQESFLQGRGQSLSACAQCEVRYLPESLFTPPPTSATPTVKCFRTDLEPQYTKYKKSCNGLQDMDTSILWMMPGAYQKGYSGPNNGVGGNLQTRMGMTDPNLQVMAEAQGGGPCRANYGTYGSGRSFAPYTM